MGDEHAYQREPYLTELDVEAISSGDEDGRPFVILDDTILYPEGGGQPADHGLVGDVPVTDVQRVDRDIRHYVERLVQPGAARLQLDWSRRFDHMQQHTAQHLITAVADAQHGWETTSFHLGDRRCDIELNTPLPDGGSLARLEDAVMGVVRSNRRVSARLVTPAEVSALEVRSRGMPPGHEGSVRLVEIDGVDVCACGGTHLASTAEIEAVKLLGVEAMRGGCRLHWAAGGRVRGLLGEHEARARDLRAVLDAGNDDLVAAVTGRLEKLKAADRRARRLERELARQIAGRLVESDTTLMEAHFDDAGAEFLQLVARHVVAGVGSRVVLLTASEAGEHFFLLACGSDCSVELTRPGPRIAELLGGRGGGSATLFQGKAGNMKRRTEAVDVLRQELDGAAADWRLPPV